MGSPFYILKGGNRMDQNLKTLFDLKLEKTRNALIKNNMETHIVENTEELRILMNNLVKDKSSVSVGGSQTLFETGIIDDLRSRDIIFHDRYQEGLTKEQIQDVYRKAFSDDYYIMSSNAISEEGHLINVDGNGNRVAALTFGPKHVIVIAGYNKIVVNEKEARQRVQTIAAPANAIRLNKETPCTNFGQCDDCKSKDRICSHYVVTKRQSVAGRIIVILVKENLGY